MYVPIRGDCFYVWVCLCALGCLDLLCCLCGFELLWCLLVWVLGFGYLFVVVCGLLYWFCFYLRGLVDCLVLWMLVVGFGWLIV